LRAAISISIFVFIGLLASTPAAADTDIDLAKKYFELGEKLYKRSDFKGAMDNFEKSYAYSKRAALLFNIAHCHESMGSFEKAILYYKLYLESKSANAALVKVRIKNLTRLLEEKQQADAASAPKPEPQQAPSSAPAPRPYWIPGWVLVGAGAALVATGAALGAVASSKASALEDASRLGTLPDYAEYEDLEDSGKGLELGQIVTLAVGGAAVAAGAALLIMDLVGGESERQAWIAPGVTAGGAMVSGGVRF
jgi:tetratricopeptide (TPR) repeat protein